VARRILWAALALTPAALVARYAFDIDETVLFVLSALALVPLAWLIGEATDQAAQHTGPGIGGFLNASFGNAPELIIALLAVGDGLPRVVRGTITGSVVSNVLLVLGLALFLGGDGELDGRSLRLQLGTVVGAVLLVLVPSAVGWHGGATHHTLYLVTLPVAAVLLAAYVAITVANLRIHRRAIELAEPVEGTWPLNRALATLAVATLATAFVSEVLVHSLRDFGRAVGLGEFFIAVVIVALVGNAAEHGGAVVIARRGNVRLAGEIAVTSSMQVAVFVAPAVALLSWLAGPALPLSFRVVEVATMGGAALLALAVVAGGRSRRWTGALLITAYAAAVVAYAVS